MQTSRLYVCYNGSYCRSFTLWEYEFSTFLSLVTLKLTQWPSYTNLTRSPCSYTTCANMNFLREDFRKLSSDRHTDRRTRSKLHTTSLRGWSIMSVRLSVCPSHSWVTPKRFNIIESLSPPYDRTMFLVSWSQISLPEFRDSPRTSAPERGSLCWQRKFYWYQLRDISETVRGSLRNRGRWL